MSFTGQTTQRKNVLVAGGAGYIGTHTVLTLLENGYDITVVDNLINSSDEGIKRVLQLVGCDESRVRVYHVDLCNKDELEKVFQESPRFCSCIHFAGLKAVGESVQKPLLYYENNLGGTFNLVNLLDKYGCNSIVFSSSATVKLLTVHHEKCIEMTHISHYICTGIWFCSGAYHGGDPHWPRNYQPLWSHQVHD